MREAKFHPGQADVAATEPIDLVISLVDVQPADRPRVGAKAANLAAMLRAGLPVPPGFCIGAEAYRRHARACGLAGPADGTSERLAAIRAAILDAPVAAELREQIEAHWLGLDGHPAAVRSSATVEDLPGRSAAGQYETILGVEDLSACLRAVKQCWASLWGERAVAYRRRAAGETRDAAMAVIVQAMVPADVAGVAFTADPIGGRRDWVVIEAAFGLGKAVVDGAVTPDRVVVSRRVPVVERRTTARKGLEVVPAADGGVTERPLEADRSSRPCLPDAAAVRLAGLAADVEALFGPPQDIEWALADGEFRLLQARPITALPPAPELSWEDRQVWSNVNLREAAPDPLTPMAWSLVSVFWDPMFGPLLRKSGFDFDPIRLIGLVGGRVYFNVNASAAVARYMPGRGTHDHGAVFGGAQASAGPAELNLPDADLPDIRLPWLPRILGPARLLAWLLPRTLRSGRRQLGLFAERLAAMETQPWRERSELGLLDRIEDARRIINDLLREGFPPMMSGMGMYMALVAMCRRWFGDEGGTIANRLVAGVGGLADAEAGVCLWQLAAAAHEHPEVEKAILEEETFHAVRRRIAGKPGAEAFLASWVRFLREHGHHTRGEIELCNPRWSERPDYVLSLVRSLIPGLDRTDPVARARRLARQRADLTADCRRRLRNPLKRLAFDAVLRRAQQALAFRETSKSLAVRWIATIRWTLLEIGERLARRGALDRQEDIFFLRLDELEPVVRDGTGFDARARIAPRRAEYEKWLAVSPPQVVFGRFDPDTAAAPAADAGDGVLCGYAVCPGVVRGRARVILHAGDGHVLPGEVLVAPFTDPGWTPYFLNAAAIVIGQGGLLSHGSIIAREYGIPCVTNVGQVTQLIATGQVVEVDGGKGTVRIVE